MHRLEVSGAVRHTHTHIYIYIYIYIHIYICVIRRLKVNLTIDGAIYYSQHFPFGAAFVYQDGKFWTHPRT